MIFLTTFLNNNILFLVISFLILLSAVLIIINKNPIHSILFLVLTFFSTTLLFLTFRVDFLAMLFLVLYIGAIIVLFLFVVMMLNVRIIEINERIISYIPIALIIVLIFFVLISSIVITNFLTEVSQLNINKNSFFSVLQQNSSLITSANYIPFIHRNKFTNLYLIGELLYTNYVYVFILAGIVLLIAMIGAIVLTLTEYKDNKKQDFYYQTNKDIIKSIRHLK